MAKRMAKTHLKLVTPAVGRLEAHLGMKHRNGDHRLGYSGPLLI
jgi:hypothetical protein